MMPTRSTWWRSDVDVDSWIETYRQAWEQRDADLVVPLFTEDGWYRSYIFDEPHVGHEGVRAYWESVTSTQSDVGVRMGHPIVDGDRVAVEWWTEMNSDGEPATVTGALLLRFAADGRCEELREYWHHAPERLSPPDAWGQ
jgi:hypothetical protein